MTKQDFSISIDIKNLPLVQINEIERMLRLKFTHQDRDNYKVTVIDPVGGRHSEGCGIDPLGNECPSCLYVTCKECSRWKERESN